MFAAGHPQTTNQCLPKSNPPAISITDSARFKTPRVDSPHSRAHSLAVSPSLLPLFFFCARDGPDDCRPYPGIRANRNSSDFFFRYRLFYVFCIFSLGDLLRSSEITGKHWPKLGVAEKRFTLSCMDDYRLNCDIWRRFISVETNFRRNLFISHSIALIASEVYSEVATLKKYSGHRVLKTAG